MKYRNDKVAVSIQKYVSDIIQFKVKNKDLGICSVTHCEVTNDYSLARLYISFLGNRKQEKMEELQRVKGFIRTELSKKLKLYKTPDLIFILDDSYDRGQRIEDLIKEIHKNDIERDNNINEDEEV